MTYSPGGFDICDGIPNMSFGQESIALGASLQPNGPSVIYFTDASNGNLTLPVAAQVPNKMLFVVAQGAGNAVLLPATNPTTNVADTVQSTTSYTVTNGHGALLQSDGVSNWNLILTSAV